MNDTINRQAAMLRVAKVNPVRFKSLDDFHDACVDCLKELPSAEAIPIFWLEAIVEYLEKHRPYIRGNARRASFIRALIQAWRETHPGTYNGEVTEHDDR